MICEKCKKSQEIKRKDIQVDDLPNDIPFTSRYSYYYRCKFCNFQNWIYPDEVPKD